MLFLLDMKLDHIKDAGIHILTRLNNTIKVLILSAEVNDAYLIIEAIKRGAKGFLGKDIDEDVLLENIVAVGGGKDNITSPDVGSTLLEKTAAARVASNLTPREVEAFLLFAAGFSRNQVADKMGVSLPAVDTHKRSIKDKMNLCKPVHYLLWSLKNKPAWFSRIVKHNNEITLARIPLHL